MQGYDAQAAVTNEQIIIAAEVTIDSPDFGQHGKSGLFLVTTSAFSIRLSVGAPI